MTIGIYKLCFNGTDNCYIGQSTNIEHRYRAHLNSFTTHKANPKMMEAYKLYGDPILEIVCECAVEELNDLEAEAIEIYDSVNNGLNIYSSASDTPLYYGEKHPRCKYSNEQILKVARLLTDPKNKAIDISDFTGLPLSVIQDISRLAVHSWIQKEDPETYKKLVDLKGTRKNPKGVADRGTVYPPVMSPDGIVYSNIANLSRFCDEHGLTRPNFRKLLLGKIKSSLGWKLVSNG